jgi:hypothetical protein
MSVRMTARSPISSASANGQVPGSGRKILSRGLVCADAYREQSNRRQARRTVRGTSCANKDRQQLPGGGPAPTNQVHTTELRPPDRATRLANVTLAGYHGARRAPRAHRQALRAISARIPAATCGAKPSWRRSWRGLWSASRPRESINPTRNGDGQRGKSDSGAPTISSTRTRYNNESTKREQVGDNANCHLEGLVL